MRSLRSVALASVASLSVIAACSSDEGVLLVLHGDAAATRIEVVLASPTAIVPVMQRKTTASYEEEAVVYYKQQSTSGSVSLDIPIEGFMIRVVPNPSAEQFVPFVFAYDAQDVLVAVGRIPGSDPDVTPLAIEIPTGRVDRYDVMLEPMAPPDPTLGIAASSGKTVTCSVDQVVRGAAWRFAAGTQLRIVFPAPGEDSAVDRPLDLDCDDHDADNQMDCNDLNLGFHPGQAEVCNDLDFNCDAAPARGDVCVVGPGTPTSQCMGHTVCTVGPIDTCLPDDPEAAACRCIVNTCISGGCTLDYHDAVTPSFVAPCAPATAVITGVCPDAVAPCEVKVKDQPMGWTITVGTRPPPGGIVTFGDTTTLTNGDAPLFVQAAFTDASTVEVMGNAAQSFGVIDLEIAPSLGTKKERAFLGLHLADHADLQSCPTITLPNATIATSSMTCTGF